MGLEFCEAYETFLEKHRKGSVGERGSAPARSGKPASQASAAGVRAREKRETRVSGERSKQPHWEFPRIPAIVRDLKIRMLEKPIESRNAFDVGSHARVERGREKIKSCAYLRKKRKNNAYSQICGESEKVALFWE